MNFRGFENKHDLNLNIKFGAWLWFVSYKSESSAGGMGAEEHMRNRVCDGRWLLMVHKSTYGNCVIVFVNDDHKVVVDRQKNTSVRFSWLRPIILEPSDGWREILRFSFEYTLEYRNLVNNSLVDVCLFIGTKLHEKQFDFGIFWLYEVFDYLATSSDDCVGWEIMRILIYSKGFVYILNCIE